MNAPAPGSVRFDAQLIARYEGRGPRYTSYPTALQFTDDFTADDYGKFALCSNQSERPLSLYVHIPFCQSLCYYCGCNKIVTRNLTRISNYLEKLYREIDMQAELYSSARRVTQLHFGGGTPTYLSDEQLSDLLAHLAQAFTFAAAEQREFSIEVDPRSVNADSIRMLAGLGFNRLSLGIQDFDAAVQKAVNRIQSETDVQQLIDTARAAGFQSTSFDLIYGLPLQTTASFDRTLQTVIAMRPDRLAVYNYAHLPDRFKGQRLISSAQIPPADTKLEILHHTIETLCAAGYHYVGMDHFALPQDDLVRAQQDQTLQRNFQGYSTHRRCDLIGLGVSAISHVGDSFSQNAATTMQYEALLENQQLPIRQGLAIDNEDIIRADVIQALMCYDVVNFAEFDEQHGISFRQYFGDEIEQLLPLQADGLVELSADRIQVTPRGRLLMRNIAMTFDRHLEHVASDVRYSKAI